MIGVFTVGSSVLSRGIIVVVPDALVLKMYGSTSNPGIMPYPPWVSRVLRTPANQPSASRVGISTLYGALLTGRITAFVPDASLLLSSGGIYDSEMGRYHIFHGCRDFTISANQ